MQDLDETAAVAKDATIVSDADRTLHKAFITEERRQQLDLVHLVRTAGYKLWQDQQLSLAEREGVLDSLENVIYPLAYAVEWARETDASTESWLRERIDETVETLRQLATNLHTIACRTAATSVRECANQAVTFDRLALGDVHVPWSSNRIKRFIGEISKRFKHQWMRWTTRGQEAILRLLLTRYTTEKQ